MLDWIRRCVVRCTTLGVRRAAGQLASELRIQRTNRLGRRRAKRYALARDLRLHIGCGTNRKPGWVNIDLSEPCELQLDLREDMPFEDEVAAMVYAEHFLEHLLHPVDSMHFLKECLRVLRPGGAIRIVVPDTEWPLRAYVNDDDEYFRLARERWHVKSGCRTRLDHINYHFRQNGDHLYAYDYETLADMLNTTGFVDVRKDEYDPDLDTPERRIGSLYVSARRPDSLP